MLINDMIKSVSQLRRNDWMHVPVLNPRGNNVFSFKRCNKNALRFSSASVTVKQPLKKSNLDAVSAVAGGAAGFLGSLCGVGGGVVIIPTLKHFTRGSITTQQMTATSLFAITISTCFGAYAYIENQQANVPAALSIALISTISSAIGARVAKVRMSSGGLSKALGAAMLLMIPLVLFGGSAKQENEPAVPTVGKDGFSQMISDANAFVEDKPLSQVVNEVKGYLIENIRYPIIGAITGFTSGVFGIGGGTLMTTMMASTGTIEEAFRKYVVGREFTTAELEERKKINAHSQHAAVATSLVAMFPTAVGGTITNTLQGNVLFRVGLILAATSSVTMYFTARYVTPRIKDENLRYIFSMVLGVSAIRMLR